MWALVQLEDAPDRLELLTYAPVEQGYWTSLPDLAVGFDPVLARIAFLATSAEAIIHDFLKHRLASH